MSLTLLTALLAPGEQHKSWDPNCCKLTSLIKADLHFHEWLAAGRKEKQQQLGCRAGREGWQGLSELPLLQLWNFGCSLG